MTSKPRSEIDYAPSGFGLLMSDTSSSAVRLIIPVAI